MIKEVQGNDFFELARIEQNAYASVMNGSLEEREQLAKVYRSFSEDKAITAFGFYDPELIGGVLFYECTMNFHGKMIQVAAIGSLAVDLLHKKKHIAQQLIMYCIEQAKAKDFDMFYLYPFKTEFYRNFGFGYSTPMFTYHIKPEHLINNGNLKHLKRIIDNDYDKILDYHNHYTIKTNGMMMKTFGDLHKLKRYKKAQIVIHETKQINGYMIFTLESLKSNDIHGQKMVIHECLYNRDALLDFICFLHVQKDQVDYIEWSTHDINFHYLINQISYASKHKSLNILSIKSSETALGLMLLALNPSKLLKELSSRTSYHIQFKIKYPKKGIVLHHINSVDEPIIIELSINDFSSWVTGSITLVDLYQHALVKCSHPELLGTLDHDFNFSKPMSIARF